MADDSMDEPGAAYPHDPSSDADPAALAALGPALADLSFLRDGVTTPEPMPEWAWARISAALAAEPALGAPSAAPVDAAAATAAAATAVVVPLDSARRPSRAARWAGGLVAASVAVLAVGVGVTAFNGSGSGGAVVAGDAAAASAEALLASAAPGAGKQAPTSEQSLAAAPPLDAGVLEAPEAMSFAGIAPAQMLVDSDTAYTQGGLRAQVKQVLRAFGVGDEEQAKAVMAEPPVMEMAEPPTTGLLSSAEGLRDCITKLTKDAEATALMVDQSTFEGDPANVVVAPDYEQEATPPALAMNELEVWVVDPDCDITMKVHIRLAD